MNALSARKKQIIKIVVMGPGASGKTVLCNRFVKKEFVSCPRATIGSDFYIDTFEFDGEEFSVQFWDTPGQERFETFDKALFRRANGVVFVYDVTDVNNFKETVRWMEYYRKIFDEDTCMIIVGNKSDLGEKREVSTLRGYKNKFVGARVSESTGKCEGLSHSWGINQTIQSGYAYAKKTFVQEIFQPPIRQSSSLVGWIIPGIFDEGAQVDVDITMPSANRTFSVSLCNTMETFTGWDGHLCIHVSLCCKQNKKSTNTQIKSGRKHLIIQGRQLGSISVQFQFYFITITLYALFLGTLYLTVYFILIHRIVLISLAFLTNLAYKEPIQHSKQ